MQRSKLPNRVSRKSRLDNFPKQLDLDNPSLVFTNVRDLHLGTLITLDVNAGKNLEQVVWIVCNPSAAARVLDTFDLLCPLIVQCLQTRFGEVWLPVASIIFWSQQELLVPYSRQCAWGGVRLRSESLSGGSSSFGKGERLAWRSQGPKTLQIRISETSILPQNIDRLIKVMISI